MDWITTLNDIERERGVALCDAQLAGLKMCAAAKAYRESLGLSVRVFAYRIETDPSAYAKFERGVYSVPIARRVREHSRGER